MKPFDLEKALKGEPVVTREGLEVTQLTHFTVAEGVPLRGVVDGFVASFSENGRYSGIAAHKYDLFMKSKKKTVWVNFYKINGSFVSITYETSKHADINSGENRIGGRAYPVEIEL